MFKNLAAWTIGAGELSLTEQMRLAKRIGFGGIDFSVEAAMDLATEHGADYVQELFAAEGILPGQWGLPIQWLDDAKYEEGLRRLPAQAAFARDLGCTRTSTWCPPASDERTYDENLAWHVARFRPIAEILAGEGCSLGIEFIGPKTSRSRRKYEFIYTLDGMMDMARVIGTGNVGVLLDAWHLYTSGGSIEDLDHLAVEDVVTVHVNDAPSGVAVEEQVDNVRAMPAETGVIDLAGFMKKLVDMGYDGPITPEPFSAQLKAISDPLEAGQLLATYMDRLWQVAGLA